MLIVGFQGGGGGGGAAITSLTQDVIATGPGAAEATVVQAQDGTFLFNSDGAFSSTTTVNFFMGPSTFTGDAWTLNVGGPGGGSGTPPTANNFALLVNTLARTTQLNAQNASGEVYITAGNTTSPGILADFDSNGASLCTHGQNAAFFQTSTSGVPFSPACTIQASNPDHTVVALYQRLTNIGMWIVNPPVTPATDTGPRGFCFIGAEVGSQGGAVSSAAPNGLGTVNTQTGESDWERFYTRTTAGAPATATNWPINTGTFIGLLSVTARLNVVGGGGGTIGDRYSFMAILQGKNLAGTVTVSTTLLGSLDADTSMLANTFVVTAGAGELVFTATGILAGGQGTIDWQWDVKDLLIN